MPRVRVLQRAYFSAVYYLINILLSPAVLAQTQNKCSGTAIFQSDSDGDVLEACAVWSGDVNITSGASGSSPTKPLFGGVQKIDGNLYIIDASALESYVFPNLEVISGDFVLRNLPNYNNAYSMPKLNQVGGAIDWRQLPKFAVYLTLANLHSVSSITIVNTAMTDLDGGSLETVGAITITDNPAMKMIQLPVANLTGPFVAENNSENLSLSFPNLVSADSMTINDVANFTAPKLETVTGVMGFHNNTFRSLLLPSLSTVSGGMNCSGGLRTLDIPSASNINGITIESTDEFDCTQLKKLQQQGVIHGTFTCDANVSLSSPGSSPPSNPLGPTSASKPKSHIGAIVGGVIGGLVVIIAVLGGVFYLGRRSTDPNKGSIFTRKKRKSPEENAYSKAELPADSKSQFAGELDGDSTRHELDGLGTQAVSELPTPIAAKLGYTEAHELAGKEGAAQRVYTETEPVAGDR